MGGRSAFPAPQFDGGIITVQLRELDVNVDSGWRQSQLDVDLLSHVATPDERPGLHERKVAHQNDGADTKSASSISSYDEIRGDLAVHVDGALHLALLRCFWAAVGFALVSAAGGRFSALQRGGQGAGSVLPSQKYKPAAVQPPASMAADKSLPVPAC